MRIKMLITMAFAGFMAAGISYATGDAAPRLAPGYYDAKVKAIPCDCCQELLEATMRSVPGVGAAQYNDKKKTVRFTVMRGKTLSLPELTEALQAAQQQMGMGADYTLSDITPLKKR